ncbi:MAG: TIGR03364 family FAD-dependent oxidoreductase [Limisphaerales bacterium]
MPGLHLVVIGAGIAGLAHAWAAARRGWRVTVFEREGRARGASVRNFGMFWALGQPPELRPAVLRSRERWREFLAATGAWHRECGAVIVAAHADEAAVLEEFAACGAADGVEVWTGVQVEARCPAVRRGVARAGLFSPHEINVDPREALARLPDFLAARHGVAFRWSTAVTATETGRIRTAAGEWLACDAAVICSGSDLETLLPGTFSGAGLQRCRLQMLRTVPQPTGWSPGPLLAGGLSLRHYASFAGCPSVAAVRARVARETPELDRFGIHVMAALDRHGALVLGDSHEYGLDDGLGEKAEIEALIVRELRRLFGFPDWTVAERWHGVYAKHATGAAFRAEPLPGVHVVTGLGGAGMTLAFGLADEAVWPGSRGTQKD